jgi:hypothetical protein
MEARVKVDYLHEDRKDAVNLEDARKLLPTWWRPEWKLTNWHLHEDRKDAVCLVEA